MPKSTALTGPDGHLTGYDRLILGMDNVDLFTNHKPLRLKAGG